MAIRYYDDAIVAKLKKWIPDNSNLRVLNPNETKRLFEMHADDTKDKPIELPVIALSRNKDIELLLNIKNVKSFDGLKLMQTDMQTMQFNVIPIKAQYQLDIFTKKADQGDEYVRNFLFKLINNPVIYIEIPYNNTNIKHIANLRVLSTVSDTSDISERLFAGQFTRWSIQIELQDGFLFSIPYRQNWKIGGVDIDVTDKIGTTGEIEEVINFDDNQE